MTGPTSPPGRRGRRARRPERSRGRAGARHRRPAKPGSAFRRTTSSRSPPPIETSADYIAFGPIFATTTKENPDPVVGLDLLAQVRRRTRKPLVAIGGITLERAEAVYRAGADSLAVTRDLMAAADPAAQRARIPGSRRARASTHSAEVPPRHERYCARFRVTPTGAPRRRIPASSAAWACSIRPPWSSAR